VILFEFRVHQPDVLVLHDPKARIKRAGHRRAQGRAVSARQFQPVRSRRTTCPIQVNHRGGAFAGNIRGGVRVKLDRAPSRPPLDSPAIADPRRGLEQRSRGGAWPMRRRSLLQGLVKEIPERTDVHELSSAGMLNYGWNERRWARRSSRKIPAVELISGINRWSRSIRRLPMRCRQQEQAA